VECRREAPCAHDAVREVGLDAPDPAEADALGAAEDAAVHGCLAVWFNAKAGICPAIKRGAPGPGRVCMTTNQHEIATMTLREMEALNARVARLEAAVKLDLFGGLLGGGKIDAAHTLYTFVHDKMGKAVTELAIAGDIVTFKVNTTSVTINGADAKNITITMAGSGNNSTMTFSKVADAQKYLSTAAPGLKSEIDIRPYTSAILRQQARTGHLG